jgi:hypothetical protein
VLASVRYEKNVVSPTLFAIRQCHRNDEGFHNNRDLSS